ncbi:MAG: helix-turn-helix domain-containing protein [Thermoleophilaceae bacterium]
MTDTRSSFLEGLEEVSAAVEGGAGLPTVARASSRALAASVVVLDTASSVLAVACQSSEDERAVVAGEHGSGRVELRVADEVVGELRMRAWEEPPEPALLRMVTTLLGLEVDRARAPGRATEAAVGDFLADLLGRTLTDRENVVARAGELGCDLGEGGAVVVVRARPQQPEEGDWRARVLTLAERGARAVERTSLAAAVAFGPPRRNAVHGEGRAPRPERELVILVPGKGPDPGSRVAHSVEGELQAGLTGYHVTVALSRPTADPVDLHRAGAEALLAANVAAARGETLLAFDETGAYRLLLPAMSEDPSELERFQEETVAPLVEYDAQYETELVRTLETFLAADGSVARTAERLFTHRHTIRYRLDRVRELSGLDVGSTDGRERLSLGLKAMRVLGISPPGGPAHEPGTSAGRIPRDSGR